MSFKNKMISYAAREQPFMYSWVAMSVPPPDHFCWEITYIFDACLDWKRITFDCVTRFCHGSAALWLFRSGEGESCQGISWDNAHHKEVGESGCFLKLSLVRACLSFLSIKPVEQHPEWELIHPDMHITVQAFHLLKCQWKLISCCA